MIRYAGKSVWCQYSAAAPGMAETAQALGGSLQDIVRQDELRLDGGNDINYTKRKIRRRWMVMGFQDDYVMRTISDLVRAIARLALGKNDIDYELPEDEDKYTPMDRVYRQLKDMADAGDINGAENYLSDQLDPQDIDRLEMALTFYMYLNQMKDDTLFEANYSREEIVDGINSVCAEYGISGFEHFVDTTMV